MLRETGLFFSHLANAGVYAIGVGFLWLAGAALGTATGVAAFFAAWLAFPIVEYVSHRYVLHAPKSRRLLLGRMQERLHHAHHRDPEDLTKVFGPLWATLPTAVGWWLLAWALTGQTALAHAFSAGMSFVYLYYEWAHFVAHRPIRPRTPWGRWMKSFHLWHHHKNEGLWYGVTSPLVDLVVGTHMDVHRAPKSPTTHDIR